MKKITAGILVAIILAFSPTVSSAENIENYGTPDKVAKSMYLRGIPMESIMKATVQNIVNKAPQGMLSRASVCMKKYMTITSYHDVVKIMMAAHPGILSATNTSSLHESADGQKVLFFCGDHLQEASPVVKAEIQHTMKKYLKIAFNGLPAKS